METDFWNGKRVLVTGVSGFVGPYLARAVIEKGGTVYGLIRSRADKSLSRNLSDATLASEIRFREADIDELYGVIRTVDEVQPDVVFHLAAQSMVQDSFVNPLLFARTNCIGTTNILEAVRLRAPRSRFIFAGSSEEYGLVLIDEEHYRRVLDSHGPVQPAPWRMPELPVSETNPLRPMSPYAATKVYGDCLVRNYARAFRIHAIVSRAFNHEGGGRGIKFVTSQIASQVVRVTRGEASQITLGDVTTFRDWSHVRDIVGGYCLLAERGTPGEVYNQGTGRTNSVLSYLLLALEEVGWRVREIATAGGAKRIEDPAAPIRLKMFGQEFEATRVDQLLLDREVQFDLGDGGLDVCTEKGTVRVVFDAERFRLSDVPILMCDNRKVAALGYRPKVSLREIVRDQINYYYAPENHTGFVS